MKIREILKEETEKKMPHLYLDMDGVQADFFGAWSKKSGVDHWKAIGNKEQEIEELANSSAKEVYDFFYKKLEKYGVRIDVDLELKEL